MSATRSALLQACKRSELENDITPPGQEGWLRAGMKRREASIARADDEMDSSW
jgi:hypothetical protein